MISMWDKMVEESNHYSHQKLRDQFESFCAITQVEMRALIGIIISMGIVKLPAYALYRLGDECLGNLGIKKVIAKNKFEYLTCFIHFNDSTMEPTEITITFSTFDLFYVMPILKY